MGSIGINTRQYAKFAGLRVVVERSCRLLCRQANIYPHRNMFQFWPRGSLACANRIQLGLSLKCSTQCYTLVIETL